MPHQRKNIRLSNRDYSRPGRYFITICTWKHECYLGNINGGEMKLSAVGEMARQCWEQITVHFPDVQPGPYVIMPNHVHGVLCIHSRPIDDSRSLCMPRGDIIPLCRDNITRSRDTIYRAPTTGNVVPTNNGVSSTGNDAQPEYSDLLRQGNDGNYHLCRDTIYCVPTEMNNIPANQDSSSDGNEYPKNEQTDSLVFNRFSNSVPGSVSVIIGNFKAAVTRWCNKNGHKYFAWQSRFYDHVIMNDDDFQRIENYILNNPRNWDTDDYYKITANL